VLDHGRPLPNQDVQQSIDSFASSISISEGELRYRNRSKTASAQVQVQQLLCIAEEIWLIDFQFSQLVGQQHPQFQYLLYQYIQ
jgi:hypothetical protein